MAAKRRQRSHYKRRMSSRRLRQKSSPIEEEVPPRSDARALVGRLPEGVRQMVLASVPRDRRCSTLRLRATCSDGRPAIDVMATATRVLCSQRCPEGARFTTECRTPVADATSQQIVARGFFALARAMEAERPLPEFFQLKAEEDATQKLTFSFFHLGTRMTMYYHNVRNRETPRIASMTCKPGAAESVICKEHFARSDPERRGLQCALSYLCGGRAMSSTPFDDGAVWNVVADFTSATGSQLSQRIDAVARRLRAEAKR